MMKQAQVLQKKMNDAQQQFENLEVNGIAGGGMVSCIATAKGVMKKITIDKSLLNPDDVEMLEDLIIAAFADAKRKADELVKKTMDNLGLPSDIMG